MKKLNITRKQFSESKYFQKKYGTLKYVNESGRLYKTSKGHILKFNESVKGPINLTESEFDALYGRIERDIKRAERGHGEEPIEMLDSGKFAEMALQHLKSMNIPVPRYASPYDIEISYSKSRYVDDGDSDEMEYESEVISIAELVEYIYNHC